MTKMSAFLQTNMYRGLECEYVVAHVATALLAAATWWLAYLASTI